MNPEIIVERSNSGEGMWYWSFSVDGEIVADGEEGSREEAKRKAKLTMNEWKAKNCN